MDEKNIGIAHLAYEKYIVFILFEVIKKYFYILKAKFLYEKFQIFFNTFQYKLYDKKICKFLLQSVDTTT